tara:strand:- start:387 stop:638 length:252 start_codon:yes stop_codon:yes gene_type:complete
VNKKKDIYKEGLLKGDLVYLNHKIGFLNYNMNCLVLDRKYLFEKETRFGLRKFFEYEVLSLERNKIIKIKTQAIKVLKATRGK